MKQPSPHPLSPDVLSPVADYFKVVSETSRLQILNCLHEGPLNVMELTEA
jgi:DNA-binding transcriptional ArsR family regulator